MFKYYRVMLARLTIDYFRSVLCCRKWQNPEDWKCALSTIRTSMFSNQNCELSLHDSGYLLLTFLDGDLYGIKTELAKRMEQRKEAGSNKVSWGGGYRCSDCYQKSIRGLKVVLKCPCLSGVETTPEKSVVIKIFESFV